MQVNFAGVWAGVACIALGAPTRADMITPAQFEVSQGGTATYTVPLQIVPGVAAMQPSLALSYDSQAGDGLFGVGWRLSGLSAIGRCPRTIAQDGVAGTVNFDTNDRYCLDGQRLIVVSGAYGADGAEYRTEFESYSKIVSYGQAGNGPAWFKVWAKSGQIMEYGNTADSRIEVQGRTDVSNWALNKSTDRYNNYIAASYTEDNANGQYFVSRIDYTGNSAINAAPTNSVRFVYRTRPDVSTLYHMGLAVKNTVLMDKVQAYLAGSVVREYRFSYEQDSTQPGNRSRMIALNECDGAGACLPATRFGWSNASAAAGFTFARSLPSVGVLYNSYVDAAQRDIVTGDFNGDGRTDLLHLHPNADPQYSWVALAKGDGTFNFMRSLPGASIATNSYLDGSFKDIVAGDFNGDGKTDILHLHPNSTANHNPQYSWVGLSRGDGTFNFMRTLPGSTTGTNSYLHPSYREILAGDFNGDGKTDLLRLHPNADPVYSWVALSNGDGTFAFTRSLPGASAATNSFLDGSHHTLTGGDFNGDGKMDMLHLHPNSSGPADPQYSWVALSKGDGTFTFMRSLPGAAALTNSFLDGTHKNILAGDFNGDGKTYMLHLHPNSSGPADPQYSWVALSKGDGTFVFTRSLPGAAATTNSYLDGSHNIIVPGDFNGDGKTDMLHLHPNGDPQYSWVALSKGDGTFVFARSLPGAAVATSSYINSTYSEVLSGDYNGDGRTDLLHRHPDLSPAFSWVALAAGTTPDQVVSITTGLGAVTQIGYKTLADDAVYLASSETASAYPIVSVRPPMQVVASVSSSNGAGGLVATGYKYGGMKFAHQGRGLLGFAVNEVTTAGGQKVRTEFRQDFPHAGSVGKTVKTAGNGIELTSTTNTYACIDSSGGTCAPAVGRRYFPYLSQSIEVTNDLNGAFIGRTRSVQDNFDAYGNVGRTLVEYQDASGAFEGYRKTTVNTYDNDAANWILGRLKRSQVTSESSSAVAGAGKVTPVPLALAVAANTLTINSATHGGTASGTISTTYSGGSAPYRFDWVRTSGSRINVSGTSTGTFSVAVNARENFTETFRLTLTDGLGDTVSATVNVTATGPAVSDLNVGVSPSSFNATATVTATASGGAPPYTYTWTTNGTVSITSQPSPTVVVVRNPDPAVCNINEGAATVTVRDAIGQVKTGSSTSRRGSSTPPEGQGCP